MASFGCAEPSTECLVLGANGGNRCVKEVKRLHVAQEIAPTGYRSQRYCRRRKKTAQTEAQFQYGLASLGSTDLPAKAQSHGNVRSGSRDQRLCSCLVFGEQPMAACCNAETSRCLPELRCGRGSGFSSYAQRPSRILGPQ